MLQFVNRFFNRCECLLMPLNIFDKEFSHEIKSLEPFSFPVNTVQNLILQHQPRFILFEYVVVFFAHLGIYKSNHAFFGLHMFEGLIDEIGYFFGFRFVCFVEVD